MYLPSSEDVAGTFCAELHLKIREKISQHAVIRTRHNRLQKIADTVIPIRAFKHSDGSILLDHLDIDPFISDHYSAKAISSLRPYGLNNMTFGAVLGLLRKDLESRLSRMKSNDLGDDAHSRTAQPLPRVALTSEGRRAELSSLDVLTLKNGFWVSPNSGPVSFPTTEGVSIPDPQSGPNRHRE